MSLDAIGRHQVGALYRLHHGWLQGWLTSRMGNACEAADLAQDTFVRVLLAVGRSEPSLHLDALQEPRAYLTTVAKRVLFNHYRRQSLERAWLQAVAQLPEAEAPGPEQQLEMLEALCEIDALLDGLKPQVREAFLMAQLEGLTYAEIALRLHVCERSIKRYVAQGLAHCVLALA
ncbi:MULTISPECIES: sigma-70 family RNA polymerase sigma factor [unclassified Pseudomonas]|uniref:sigma-70 family RNA polymerase sigma factor n=1 Tax=unclassified Pseudomonas TaxID=196821 RepID=UPI00244AE3B5|nr:MULTISPECIES: sigma-70 family RNA polymerase sigma factor [unclassified Pseudomonas]MDG9925060.1 sigma-70 family RNA polymerase sigma factor [Pseudomonas sp. GD04045]MDH0037065.1 sigma-70 family RNA polymerase sigma factor [Pseudomonas sp. GD04019]